MTNDPAFAEPWRDAPLRSLVDHIVAHYHQQLRVSLPRIESLGQSLADASADDAAATAAELLDVFRGLRVELEDHMAKEEHILFPMISGGQGFMADGPIAMMEAEHAAADEAIQILHDLTDGYRPASDASTECVALWRELERFAQEMHEHIYLENEILFPRALEG